MPNRDAFSDAAWILESIIDDFAESLTPPDRARFYAELAELLARRRDDGGRLPEEFGTEPDLPPRVQ